MQTFSGKHIDLTGTDALVVTEDGTLVHGVRIRDAADPVTLNKAHRDGVQLYKPIVNNIFNAQFAGSQLHDIEIRGCDIRSPGKLQCIFAGDGLVRRPVIVDNVLETKGQHYISIAAPEGFIAGNYTPDGMLAPIKLFPLSIGGNSDGKMRIQIMSFKRNSVMYLPADEIVRDGTLDHVTDFRFEPTNRENFVYLYDFDLELFEDMAFSRQHTANDLREKALEFGTTERPVSVYISREDITVKPVFDPLAHFGDAIINPKTGHPLRNYGANNPGNIKDFGIRWLNRVDPDDTARMTEAQQREVGRRDRGDDHMVIFEHPRDGFRALALDLLNKQRRHKLKTIREIMNRYAPKGKENPAQEAYIWNIAAQVGVKPDEVISVSDWYIMRRFIEAIVTEESGATVGNLYPEDWIREGMISAGVPYPGEEDASRPLNESRTVRSGGTAAGGIAGTGVVAVVKAVTGTDSTTAEVLTEVAKGDVSAASDILLNDPGKVSMVIEAVKQANSWGALDYIQLALIAVAAFGVLDILSDRWLSRKLKIK